MISRIFLTFASIIYRFMLFDTISLQLFTQTDDWKENGRIFLQGDFFMLRDFALQGRQFLVPAQPYLLQEGRVVWVRRGEASYSFNLVDLHFEAGDLVVFSGDTLVEKKGHSADFQFDAFNFPIVEGSGAGDAPSYLRLHLDGNSETIIGQYFDLMWQLLHTSPQFPEENIGMLTRSLLCYVGSLDVQPESAPSVSRRDDQLRRFVSLVSRHAIRERTIPFYADQLCMAPHYLSTFVKQASGRTVMQWINQTVVKEIKVWLAYSDETAAQISDRLNFPCPSSLTKFFKRETGHTPIEYREMTRLHVNRRL